MFRERREQIAKARPNIHPAVPYSSQFVKGFFLTPTLRHSLQVAMQLSTSEFFTTFCGALCFSKCLSMSYCFEYAVQSLDAFFFFSVYSFKFPFWLPGISHEDSPPSLSLQPQVNKQFIQRNRCVVQACCFFLSPPIMEICHHITTKTGLGKDSPCM